MKIPVSSSFFSAIKSQGSAQFMDFSPFDPASEHWKEERFEHFPLRHRPQTTNRHQKPIETP